PGVFRFAEQPVEDVQHRLTLAAAGVPERFATIPVVQGAPELDEDTPIRDEKAQFAPILRSPFEWEDVLNIKVEGDTGDREAHADVDIVAPIAEGNASPAAAAAKMPGDARAPWLRSVGALRSGQAHPEASAPVPPQRPLCAATRVPSLVQVLCPEVKDRLDH